MEEKILLGIELGSRGFQRTIDRMEFLHSIEKGKSEFQPGGDRCRRAPQKGYLLQKD